MNFLVWLLGCQHSTLFTLRWLYTMTLLWRQSIKDEGSSNRENPITSTLNNFHKGVRVSRNDIWTNHGYFEPSLSLSYWADPREFRLTHTQFFFHREYIALWRKLNRDFLLADRLKSLRLAGNLSGWLATSILRLLHKLLNIPLSPTANNTNDCKEGAVTVYFNGPPKHNSWMLKIVPD